MAGTVNSSLQFRVCGDGFEEKEQTNKQTKMATYNPTIMVQLRFEQHQYNCGEDLPQT